MKTSEKAVSAADANRRFSDYELLRSVREGRSFVVTTHGKPIAKIVPIGRGQNTTTGARRALLTRLRAEPVTEIGRWTRDELCEDPR